MPADSTARTVSESLFDPLIESLLQCDRTRLCPALPDLDWVRLCLGRVLQESRSGRGFLQEYGARWSKCPERGAFFESLKSRCRLGLLEQLNGYNLAARGAQETQGDLGLGQGRDRLPAVAPMEAGGGYLEPVPKAAVF